MPADIDKGLFSSPDESSLLITCRLLRFVELDFVCSASEESEEATKLRLLGSIGLSVSDSSLEESFGTTKRFRLGVPDFLSVPLLPATAL